MTSTKNQFSHRKSKTVHTDIILENIDKKINISLNGILNKGTYLI